MNKSAPSRVITYGADCISSFQDRPLRSNGTVKRDSWFHGAIIGGTTQPQRVSFFTPALQRQILRRGNLANWDFDQIVPCLRVTRLCDNFCGD